MATIRGKRKREIQDEKEDLADNFQVLRRAGECKKRRLSAVSSKPEIKQENVIERRTRSQVNLSTSHALPPVHPSPMRRRDSLMRIRKPLMTLRGSIRGKIAEQVRRSMMKGKQDYSLPMASTVGQMDFFNFVSALEEKNTKNKDSLKDQYLQEKIDHEIRMRDGTAKLLAASKRPQQMLEAAKSLLTSNTRMMAMMSELQKRKTDEVMKRRSKAEDGNQVPCKARVSISDLRIPLMWKDSDHFKNKGDYRRYAVFCLMKIGTDIQDTVLQKEVDRCMTDLTFDDPVVFNNVKPDFECRIEVYRHKLSDDLTMASTPKKIKKRINDISNSVGRSVGRRLSGLKDDPEFMSSMIVGPKFDCVAHATLKLANVSNSVGTHDLVLEIPQSNPDSCSELPLFDNFCCRVAAEPYCMTEETTSGSLAVKVRGRPGWSEYYCQLKGLTIACWDSEEASTNSEPSLSIPVTKTTQISEAKRDEYDFCLCLRNRAAVAMLSQVFIATKNQSEISRWWEGLQQHLLDQVMWQHACDASMSVPQTTPPKASTYLQKMVAAQSAECDSPMTKILNRLNVNGENVNERAIDVERRPKPSKEAAPAAPLSRNSNPERTSGKRKDPAALKQDRNSFPIAISSREHKMESKEDQPEKIQKDDSVKAGKSHQLETQQQASLRRELVMELKRQSKVETSSEATSDTGAGATDGSATSDGELATEPGTVEQKREKPAKGTKMKKKKKKSKKASESGSGSELGPTDSAEKLTADQQQNGQHSDSSDDSAKEPETSQATAIEKAAETETEVPRRMLRSQSFKGLQTQSNVQTEV